MVIVVGRKHYLDLIDHITDQVDLDEDVHILYHSVDYDMDSYFLIIENAVTQHTYGTIVSTFA